MPERIDNGFYLELFSGQEHPASWLTQASVALQLLYALPLEKSGLPCKGNEAGLRPSKTFFTFLLCPRSPVTVVNDWETV
jgi:hypothetical protein